MLSKELLVLPQTNLLHLVGFFCGFIAHPLIPFTAAYRSPNSRHSEPRSFDRESEFARNKVRSGSNHNHTLSHFNTLSSPLINLKLLVKIGLIGLIVLINTATKKNHLLERKTVQSPYKILLNQTMVIGGRAALLKNDSVCVEAEILLLTTMLHQLG